MKKRIISILVCAALVLGMVPYFTNGHVRAADGITAEYLESLTDIIPADAVNANTDVKTIYYAVTDIYGATTTVYYCTTCSAWYSSRTHGQWTHIDKNKFTPVADASDSVDFTAQHVNFYSTDAAARAHSTTFATITSGGDGGGETGGGETGGGETGGGETGGGETGGGETGGGETGGGETGGGETGGGETGGGSGSTVTQIPEPDWEYSGVNSTEGLVVDKTISDNGDGTYTVTVTTYVTGSVDSRPKGAVYAEELDITKDYYAVNANGDYRKMSYCETCGQWYIVDGGSNTFATLYSGNPYLPVSGTAAKTYALAAYEQCSTNHTQIAYYGVYPYQQFTNVGKFIPVGKYANTDENANSTDIQPLAVYFFDTQANATGAYNSGTHNIKTSSIVTTIEPDVKGIDADTALTDTVSKYFDLVDGSATVTIRNYGADGWADSNETLTATVDGRAINVTGFDYSGTGNFVVTDSGHEQGKQVVLTYKVTPTGAALIGGVFPEGTERAGVYEDMTHANMLAALPNPTVRFARKDESNVPLTQNDNLILEKTATDNQDGTYTITMSAFVTGVLTEIEGTVYSNKLSTSKSYYVYNPDIGSAMEVTYCSRCGEWWQTDTWHIYHFLSNKEPYKFIPRTDAADSNSTHTQFFETAAAANTAQGGTSAVQANLDLDGSAVLEDIISDYFIVDGSVGVYTSYYNGSYFSAFASSGLTADVSTDGIITVEGFDYAANAVAEGTRGGNRLVVTFDVVPKAGVLGSVPTNGVDSGIYDAGELVANFPRPTVNVIEYTVGGDEETPEMDLSGLELDKVLKSNGDGTYSIDLDAFTSGNVTTTNGVPLDVVFVLDRSYEAANYTMRGYWSFRWFWPTWNSSSSFSTNMLQLAKGGISDMILTLQNDAATTGADHRVSLISYAGTATRVEELTNVNSTKLINGNSTTGTLWNINSASENTISYSYGWFETTVNKRDNGNGSRIDLALEEAVDILGAENDSSRKKVVIVLTGSIPGDGFGNKTWGGGNAVTVANDALAQAQLLKDMGVEVYTVGLYSNANAFGEPKDEWSYINEDTYYNEWNNPTDDDYENTNRFLHFLSSDMTSGITDVQATISTYKSAVYDWTSGYSGGGDTVDEACVAFEFINNTVIAPVLTLDGTTEIRDQVTKYFDVVDGINGITVSKVDLNGNSTDITSDVNLTLSDGIISVSGYNFGENNIDESRGTGSKLHISFDITPKGGFVGGNNVPTNLAVTSGAYIPVLWCDNCQSGANIGADGICDNCDTAAEPVLPTSPSANFGTSPEANVTIMAPVVIGNDDVVSYGASTDGVVLYHRVDTVTDGWKYDYVGDIDYGVREPISNTVCGTYTVYASIAPLYDGSNAVGTVQTSTGSEDTGTLHVLTPGISVTDTMVYWGNEVDLDGLVSVSGQWTCAHGYSAAGDTSNVDLSYDVDDNQFEPDNCTNVKVYASIGGDVLTESHLEVHVLKPYLATEDATIYVKQSVDLTDLAYVIWDCDEALASASSQEDILYLMEEYYNQTAPTVNLTYSSGGDITAYAPTDCSSVSASGDYDYNGKTKDISGSVTVHVLKPEFSIGTKNVWADYDEEIKLDTWGVSAVAYNWSCDDENIPEPTGAAPEIKVGGCVFDQGTNGIYTTTENDVTVNVSNVNYTMDGDSYTGSATGSFTITTNRFDLVVKKTYTGTNVSSYKQDAVFLLSDTRAGKTIRFVGEEDGSTKVVGLVCGKDYTLNEERWSWRYVTENGGSVEGPTNGISNSDPGTQTVTMSFSNALYNTSWISFMTSLRNEFEP